MSLIMGMPWAISPPRLQPSRIPRARYHPHGFSRLASLAPAIACPAIIPPTADRARRGGTNPPQPAAAVAAIAPAITALRGGLHHRQVEPPMLELTTTPMRARASITHRAVITEAMGRQPPAPIRTTASKARTTRHMPKYMRRRFSGDAPARMIAAPFPGHSLMAERI